MLVGRWQAGDRGCHAPVSWLPGSGTSQGFPAAGLPGGRLSPGIALEKARGWPAYSVKSQGLSTSACRRDTDSYLYTFSFSFGIKFD